MFIGYSPHQKGYKCFVPETRRVLISRDVKFVESRGYYDGKSWDELKDLSQSASDRANNLRRVMESLGISMPSLPRVEPIPENVPSTATDSVQNTHPDHEGGSRNVEQSTQTQPEENSVAHDQDEMASESDAETQVEVPSEGNEAEPQQLRPLRRSTRIRKPSHWINTRVYFNAEAVAHPISAVCSLAQYPEEHQVFISELDQEYIPRTYEEAMQHKEWRESVGDEMGAMIKNDTWFETELSKEKKAVTSRLLYTIKYGANGKPERKKTRLVAGDILKYMVKII